jgi:hypothetical protein
LHPFTHSPQQRFVLIKMRFLAVAVALLPALGSAHTIAQRVRVNGQDNGQGNGIRVAPSNNPIQNVNDGSIACNANPSSSNKVINVKAGDKVGVMWGHVVGGAQYVSSCSFLPSLRIYIFIDPQTTKTTPSPPHTKAPQSSTSPPSQTPPPPPPAVLNGSK